MANDKVDPAVSALARVLGLRGASKGGKARNKSLTKTRRQEIARMGGIAGGNGRPKKT